MLFNDIQGCSLFYGQMFLIFKNLIRNMFKKTQIQKVIKSHQSKKGRNNPSPPVKKVEQKINVQK